MQSKAWDDRWHSRGEGQLTLLLWALWNPIGTCPPDEYASYSPAVAAILREEREMDSPLAQKAFDDNRIQLERNALRETAVQRLANLLADSASQRWTCRLIPALIATRLSAAFTRPGCAQLFAPRRSPVAICHSLK
jgi:hypothetical protein